MDRLTEYQKAQLLHLATCGQFKYYNSKGNKVSRSAWAKMIDALIKNGLIDVQTGRPTDKAYNWLNKNHATISLSALD